MILRSTRARPPRVTRHAAAADTMLAASSRLMRSVFSRYACAESGAWVPRAAAAAARRATGRRRMATCGNTSSAQPSPRARAVITSSVSCAPFFVSSFVSSFVSAECVETRTEVRVFVERERASSRDDGPAGVAGVSASSNPPSYSPLPHPRRWRLACAWLAPRSRGEKASRARARPRSPAPGPRPHRTSRASRPRRSAPRRRRRRRSPRTRARRAFVATDSTRARARARRARTETSSGGASRTSPPASPSSPLFHGTRARRPRDLPDRPRVSPDTGAR